MNSIDAIKAELDKALYAVVEKYQTQAIQALLRVKEGDRYTFSLDNDLDTAIEEQSESIKSLSKDDFLDLISLLAQDRKKLDA